MINTIANKMKNIDKGRLETPLLMLINPFWVLGLLVGGKKGFLIGFAFGIVFILLTLVLDKVVPENKSYPVFRKE